MRLVQINEGYYINADTITEIAKVTKDGKVFWVICRIGEEELMIHEPEELTAFERWLEANHESLW